MTERSRPAVGQVDGSSGSRPFKLPLLLIGARCIARYVLLPVVLPLLAVAAGTARGIVTGTAIVVLLVLDLLAILAIGTTLRWLWRERHPRRRQYLSAALALTALIALLFANDIRVMYASG